MSKVDKVFLSAIVLNFVAIVFAGFSFIAGGKFAWEGLKVSAAIAMVYSAYALSFSKDYVSPEQAKIENRPSPIVQKETFRMTIIATLSCAFLIYFTPADYAPLLSNLFVSGQ